VCFVTFLLWDSPPIFTSSNLLSHHTLTPIIDIFFTPIAVTIVAGVVVEDSRAVEAVAEAAIVILTIETVTEREATTTARVASLAITKKCTA